MKKRHEGGGSFIEGQASVTGLIITIKEERNMIKNSLKFIGILMLTCFTIAFLTACGSGDGGGGSNPNQPPIAEITSGNGSFYTLSDSISFSGTGTDPEDGILSGSSLVWSSDIDGEIGTGESFSTNLSEGTHVITLTATDSIDASDSKSTMVIVAFLWSQIYGGNDHSYLAISVPEGITWTDAANLVQEEGNGWYLATITSQAENDFIYSLVSEDSKYWNCCLSGNSSGPWLGGEYVGPGVGDYAWVTGEPFVFTNWAPREPFGNGQRISLFGYQTLMGAGWNDIGPDRTDPVAYIIEKGDF